MVLLAGFVVVLQRHGVGDDVAVGVPVAGRDRPEIEPLIGFFVNTLVMRTDLSGEPTFDEAVERVRATALNALSHQDIPFERLVEEFHPDRALNRNPLCQIMFQLQTSERAGGVPRERALRVDKQTANFDLAVDLFEGVDGVGGFVEYSTELYDAVTVERLVAHFRRLLEDATSDPSRPVWQLDLLDDEERHALVVLGQGPRRHRPDTTVNDLITDHAHHRGNHPAVIDADTTTSYTELTQRATDLADHIRAAGGGPGTTIGVYLPRGLPAITALLAIWQCGATYLPLDPTYPPARIDHMLHDSNAELIITTTHHHPTLPTTHHTITTITLDTLPTPPPTTPHTTTAPQPHHPAYLIYTSGSTGHPKAVTITHRALANHAVGIGEAYALDPSDVALAMASPSFDVSLEETVATLVAGATVAVAPRDRLTFDDVLQHAADHAVTDPQRAGIDAQPMDPSSESRTAHRGATVGPHRGRRQRGRRRRGRGRLAEGEPSRCDGDQRLRPHRGDDHGDHLACTDDRAPGCDPLRRSGVRSPTSTWWSSTSTTSCARSACPASSSSADHASPPATSTDPTSPPPPSATTQTCRPGATTTPATSSAGAPTPASSSSAASTNRSRCAATASSSARSKPSCAATPPSTTPSPPSNTDPATPTASSPS